MALSQLRRRLYYGLATQQLSSSSVQQCACTSSVPLTTPSTPTPSDSSSSTHSSRPYSSYSSDSARPLGALSALRPSRLHAAQHNHISRGFASDAQGPTDQGGGEVSGGPPKQTIHISLQEALTKLVSVEEKKRRTRQLCLCFLFACRSFILDTVAHNKLMLASSYSHHWQLFLDAAAHVPSTHAPRITPGRHSCAAGGAGRHFRSHQHPS